MRLGSARTRPPRSRSKPLSVGGTWRSLPDDTASSPTARPSPLAQTSSGYDITRALEEVTDKVSETDTVNLSGALEQISSVEDELPPDLRSSLDGLSRLSDTVASRDEELRQLLAGAANVSQILADRDTQVSALFGQGQSLFAALNSRADTIHRVLVQSRQVADALTGLSRDNASTLGPTLEQLKTLVATLNSNYDNINASLTGLEHFAKQVGEAVGSGPFFGVLLHNIVPANLSGQLPGSFGGAALMASVREMARALPAKLLAVVIAVALVGLVTAAWIENHSVNHVTAYFRNTTGMYVGDRVMILGVEVGRITTIEPDGERVRVEFDYDNDYDVPADAKAAVVAPPTLVTGRYIQLAPAYSGGPTLSDGDEIPPLDRTAVPVEFDEIKKQVVKLAEDAGRTPEHPDGSLNRFVSSTARTLDGTGTALHDSLTHLSDAATTLNASGEDLFGTVENLQKFTTALAASDQQIRAFSSEFANVSGVAQRQPDRTRRDAEQHADHVPGSDEVHRRQPWGAGRERRTARGHYPVARRPPGHPDVDPALGTDGAVGLLQHLRCRRQLAHRCPRRARDAGPALADLRTLDHGRRTRK